MGKDSQPTDWIPVTFFHGSKAKFIRHYVRRGDLVVSSKKVVTDSSVVSNRVQSLGNFYALRGHLSEFSFLASKRASA